LRIARPYKVFLLLVAISLSFLFGNILPLNPARKIISFLLSSMHNLKASVKDIEALKNENRKLREMASIYAVEVIKLREVIKENERLRLRLNLEPRFASWKVIWAEILESHSHQLILDKGLKNGLKIGLPVVAGNYLIGRISYLWPDRAAAIAITHSDFSAGVKLSRSNLEAVIEGLPLQNAVILKYIPKNSDILKSDKVVTSGRGGVFPSELEVGEVIEVKTEPFGFFMSIKAKPALSLSEVKDVAILIKK
jgi:rod shape-determining protein MreC